MYFPVILLCRNPFWILFLGLFYIKKHIQKSSLHENLFNCPTSCLKCSLQIKPNLYLFSSLETLFQYCFLEFDASLFVLLTYDLSLTSSLFPADPKVDPHCIWGVSEHDIGLVWVTYDRPHTPQASSQLSHLYCYIFFCPASVIKADKNW